MRFSNLLQRLEQDAPEHGRFYLRRGESVRRVALEEGLPEKPGVYLIYVGKGNRYELMYIGHAGTLVNQGKGKKAKMKEAGLLRRITRGNQEKGLRRPRFYIQELSKRGVDSLCFRWFVTFDGYGGVQGRRRRLPRIPTSPRLIPACAEVRLLQAYFDDDDSETIPPWNRQI